LWPQRIWDLLDRLGGETQPTVESFFQMAKNKIKGPTRNPSDHEYQTECQMALEPSLSYLVDAAVKSGWPKRQATYALMVMAAKELTGLEKEP
jgi:hypothetical protein